MPGSPGQVKEMADAFQGDAIGVQVVAVQQFLRVMFFQGRQDRTVQVKGDINNIVFLRYQQLFFADALPALQTAGGCGIRYEKIFDVAGDIDLVQSAEVAL